MPATMDRHWTPGDILREFAEDAPGRHECIDGVLLVTPSPRLAHEVAVGHLCSVLRRAVGDRRAVTYIAGLQFAPGALVQPDVFVLPAPLTARMQWSEVPRPLVIAEVLSPSTARVDRGLKRSFYQRAGVPEYWIVDVDARLIERWTPADERPEIVGERLAWRDSVSGVDVTLDVAAYFAGVWGDTTDG